MPNQEPNKEDLESTTPIETLEDLIEQEDYQKEDIEEDELDTFEITNTESKKKKHKEHFVKLKKWWAKRSKKQKILIISLFVVLLCVLGVGLFLLLTKEQPKPPEEPEDVIVELNNYRYENGTLIFLDENHEEIGNYECKNKDETLCFVSYYSVEDDFDNSKKMYEDNTEILEQIPIVNQTYVFLNDNKTKEDETILLYNMKTKEVAEDTYRLVKKGENETSFIVKNNTSNYGVIHLAEDVTTAISFSYDYLAYLDTAPNYYISKQNNRNVIINNAGKNISKGIAGVIKGLNKKYIKVVNETNTYSVYDYNGKEIFSGYEYVELYDDYAALIENKKMKLKFYDQTKLQEDDIVLFNTTYTPINIYDEENHLQSTEESFYIEENGNTITVHVLNNGTEKTTSLNKLEALNNKTIKFMNYFDGKLYFYSDEEKTNLLGSYNCTNKNNITKENIGLPNCSIASDTIFEDNEKETPGTVGLIPILNERYVFLNDNPDLVNEDNKTIVLYDLKAKKNMSKYKSVNTYSYTGNAEVTFKAVNDLQVVAKNKSNKFGVITINTNTVAAHVPFNYNAIEKIGDFYAASNENGSILIPIHSSGTTDFSPVSGKIKNYNDEYVTVVDNNQYFVYDYHGKKINENGYLYVALYPNFYAAVNQANHLNLYLYKDPSQGLLEEEIPLSLNHYYGEGTLAFKISTSGMKYSIEKGTSANIYEFCTNGEIPTGEES